MEDYKEKYEQALGRAKALYAKGTPDSLHLEEIFPELKESDDEKIRKTLKSFFDSEISDYGNVEWRNGIRYGEIVSWLEKQGEQSHCNGEVNDEALQQQLQIWFNKGKCSGRDEVIFHPENFGLQKQGEQKPTDKVELKFKVGDWILIDNPCKIISIDGNYIVQYCDDEKTHEISKKFCEFQFHLWTIQDAKKGDVLVWNDCGDEYIFVFDKLIKDCAHAFIEFNVYLGTIEDVNRYYQLNKLYPATKKQCDLLFQKMKEAGYEWDVEKKELKKIEQKTACELDNSYAHVIFPFKAKVKSSGTIVTIHDGELSSDGREWIKYQSDSEDGFKVYEPNNLELVCEIEQKTAWSEEDDYILNLVSKFTSKGYKSHPKIPSLEFVQDWLKSLKVRIQHQHKQEWSEEDWK